jgi:septal ring factor EnvC (AmiA/AmiB activator)
MEYEEFQADFEQRDRRIIELETQLANIDADRARIAAEEEERRRLEEEARRNQPRVQQKYVAIKGDKVDEKMAVYINNFDMDIPIQRLGDG